MTNIQDRLESPILKRYQYGQGLCSILYRGRFEVLAQAFEARDLGRWLAGASEYIRCQRNQTPR